MAGLLDPERTGYMQEVLTRPAGYAGSGAGNYAGGGGGGASSLGGIDLNQLVRPPDPLGAALAAMSQRFAEAGQASRLPTSTLGALGSALGGASTAANAAQTQYLDQAIKLQGLKRSLQQMGLTEQAAARWAQVIANEQQKRQGGAGSASPVALGAPAPAPMPAAAPGATPAAAPGAPALPGDYGAAGEYGAGQGSALPVSGGPITNTGLGGLLSPDTVIPSPQGGAGAATMLASFRPDALVASADGRAGNGAGADPLDLIAKYESGGRNIRQQVVPESVSSASGPWQMLDNTFHDAAKKVGIDVSDYKSAKDAPVELQRAVATALFNDQGYKPWAPYNPRLAAAIGSGETAAPRGLLASGERRDDGGDAALSGLLALAGVDEDPLAGLLAGDKGAVQPGPPDELIPSGNAPLAGLLRAAMTTVPGRTEPAQTTPIDQTSPENLDLTARVAQSRPPLALPGVPGMPQSLDEIARGASARPGMMLAQYAPGGAAPAAPAAPQRVPPLVGPGAGTIPGLGISPVEAVAINAIGKLGGVDMGLQPLLDLYYKSPEYLRLSEQEKEAGKSAIATPATMAINEAQAMNTIRTQMANEGLMIDPKTNQVVQIPGWAGAKARTADELEAVKNKYAEKLAETQAGFEPVTVTIRNPDGSDSVTTMSKAERKRREDMQGNRTPQPGDIVGTRVENPFDKFGIAKFGESFDAAQSARTSLENNNRVMKLIDSGIITGLGSNTGLIMEKLGTALGYGGPNKVANTEAFIASMGSEVANVIRQGKFGPPTSDADRAFAEKISGGSIALDEASIRKLFDMREEINRGIIDKHNKEWAPYVPKGSMIEGHVKAPPAYGATTGMKTDPQTGQKVKVWLRPDGQWVEY